MPIRRRLPRLRGLRVRRRLEGLCRRGHGGVQDADLLDGAAAESHMQVLVATSDDGVTWSKPVVASDAGTDCPGDQAHCLAHPVLAIGADRPPAKNEVIYVFYSSTASGGLRATHSTDGG